MTPLEELQAAHARLTELRNRERVIPGKLWVTESEPGQLDVHDVWLANVYEKLDLLHRTMDVQLAILSTAIDEVGYSGNNLTEDQFTRCDEPNACHEALVLARAINGEES